MSLPFCSFVLLPLQERSIYFLAPESDGAVFRLHSNIVVSSLRWRNDLSLSEKTINVSRWGTIYDENSPVLFRCKCGITSRRDLATFYHNNMFPVSAVGCVRPGRLTLSRGSGKPVKKGIDGVWEMDRRPVDRHPAGLCEKSHQKAKETQDDRFKKRIFFSQKQPDSQTFQKKSRQKKECAPVFHDPFSSGSGPYFSFKYNG
jgi:hypothetical protein